MFRGAKPSKLGGWRTRGKTLRAPISPQKKLVRVEMHQYAHFTGGETEAWKGMVTQGQSRGGVWPEGSCETSVGFWVTLKKSARQGTGLWEAGRNVFISPGPSTLQNVLTIQLQNLSSLMFSA